MADPFRKIGAGPSDAKDSAVVASWSRGRLPNSPVAKNWTLEHAVVSGGLACAWVHACADILAKHVASMPWLVVEPGEDQGQMVPVPGHPAQVLIETPNDFQSREYQMHMRTLHLIYAGNFVDRLVMVGGSRNPRPAEIWGLHPDAVSPIPDADEWIKAYRQIARGLHSQRDYPVSEIVHGQNPDPLNPYWGMSPLRPVGRIIDLDARQVDWNRNMVENGGAPAGAFVDPSAVSTEAKKSLKKSLKQNFSGPVHAREPLVLSGGANYIPFDHTPVEMDWIASRKFTVGEIATALGLLTSRFVPDVMTLDNLQAALRYEFEHGAAPQARKIGDALGMRLLTREERRAGRKIIPDTSSVPALRPDLHKSAESYARLVGSLVPPQTAATILDIPVGELEAGQRTFQDGRLVEWTTEAASFTGEDL